jgi:hypothetical protein
MIEEELRSGISLFGKDGAFALLLRDMLNLILEREMAIVTLKMAIERNGKAETVI